MEIQPTANNKKTYCFEIVRDFDGTYYANVSLNGNIVLGYLPAYVPYKVLSQAVKDRISCDLPRISTLSWVR